MLDKAGVEALEHRVSALARCDNDQERISLIKEWPTRADQTKPQRSPSKLGLESSQADFSDFDYKDANAMAGVLK
jgi:hypothetical protein